MFDLVLERFKLLPVIPNQTWEGGWFPLNDLKIKGEDPSTTFLAGLWLDLGNQRLGPKGDIIQRDQAATPQKLFEMLTFFALELPEGGYRPGHLHVTDKELALYLTRQLEGLDTEVVQVDSLEVLSEVAEGFADDLAFGPVEEHPLSLLNHPDLTREQIIDFGHAAVEFWRADLWNRWTDEDLIGVTEPEGDPDSRFCVVLGAAGIERGLAFFPSRDEHYRIQSEPGSGGQIREGHPILYFSFCGEEDRAFRQLRREWSQLGLPLAHPDAFPLLGRHHHDGMGETPGPEDLTWTTGLLRALARTTEQQMDSGRWSVTVAVGSQEKEYRLEMPYLLEPLTLADSIKWGNTPDPRAHAALFEAMEKLAPLSESDSPDDHQRKLDDMFTGRKMEDIVEMAGPPESATEKARQIVYSAYDAVGYRRQVMARQALALDPDCIMAWALLMEECHRQENHIDFARKAIEVGRRTLKPEEMVAEAGDLLFVPPARPYLAALITAADHLAGNPVLAKVTPESEEALEYGLEYMKYHPGDSGNLRYTVLTHLLLRDRLDEAEAMMAAWPDGDQPIPSGDPESEIMGGAADDLLLDLADILIQLKRGADPASFTGALTALHQAGNRYLLPLLLDGKKPPATAMRSAGLGGGKVALFISDHLFAPWYATPAAAQISYGRPGKKTGAKGGSGKKKKKKRR